MVTARWPSAGVRERSALVGPFDLAAAYDRYGRLLYSVAYAVLEERADAEDCLHETLLRVWKNPHSYSAARGELKSFLVVAVRNGAISMLRKRTRHKEIEATLPQEQSATEFEVPDYIQRSQLYSALRSLPNEQWEVVRLGYFEYLTHFQIAERLGLPLGTVKSRIALAMRKLAMTVPKGSP